MSRRIVEKTSSIDCPFAATFLKKNVATVAQMEACKMASLLALLQSRFSYQQNGEKVPKIF